MKKLLSVFLVFCLLISSVNVIFAAEVKESNMEELLISVKVRIGIAEDEYEFDMAHIFGAKISNLRQEECNLMS